MTNVKIRPLADRIVVRREDDQEVSDGGIVLALGAAEKPTRGEVVAVGNGKYLETGEFIEVDVSVGDIVLFGKQAGVEVEVEGTPVLIMHESDIMGILSVE